MYACIHAHTHMHIHMQIHIQIHVGGSIHIYKYIHIWRDMEREGFDRLFYYVGANLGTSL